MDIMQNKRQFSYDISYADCLCVLIGYFVDFSGVNAMKM